MKKLTTLCIVFGISSGWLFAGLTFQLTTDLNDSLVANKDPGYLGIAVHAESRFGSVYNLTEAQLDQLTNYNGTAAGRSGLFVLADAQWNDGLYVADSGKLEPVQDTGNHIGAPEVLDVHAEQSPGSKDVWVNYWLQYEDAKSSEVFIEIWFRESMTQLQWSRCMSIKSSYPNMTSVQPYGTTIGHKMNQSAVRASFTWDGGAEKPNLQTENAQIRIIAFYPKKDQYDAVLPEDQQNSGWDGYDAENGDQYTLSNSQDVGISVQHPDYAGDANMANDFFNNHISSNNIGRKGTYVTDAEDMPVYFLSAGDVSTLTGNSTANAGDYAYFYGEEFDSNGAAIGFAAKLFGVSLTASSGN